MNPREKIITQCVLCCLVFVCAKGISFLPNEQVQKAQATVQRQLETHYTEDDWKRFASGFCRKIKKTAHPSGFFIFSPRRIFSSQRSAC